MVCPPSLRLPGLREALCVAIALVAAGCQCSSGSGGAIKLNGAGASFPAPLYSRWLHDYRRASPTVQVNYQSVGSGAGITQILQRTVDFGASDAPMSDAELAKATSPILHIPTALGAVVLTYNAPGVPAGLRMSPETLVKVLLGEIATWDHPALVTENPGTTLPSLPMTVVYRTDGSGTTAVFTDYLGKVSPAWKDRVGVGKAVKWPVGTGGKGNEGVMGHIKNTPGAIGYVELEYASRAGMPMVTLKNRHGDWVVPETAGVTAAAAGATIPDDFRVSITDSPAPGAWPIAAFTYILIYAEHPDAVRGKALARFLWWAVSEGQVSAAKMNYGRLPEALITRVKARLGELTAGGKKAMDP